MKDKDLFETKAQGYKVENGKLVYFSNMLNGYKREYKDLQEICEEMNGLLKKFDSYEEQLAFWKGKAEEKLPKNSVVISREEYQKNILNANSDGYGAGKIDGNNETAEKFANRLIEIFSTAMGVCSGCALQHDKAKNPTAREFQFGKYKGFEVATKEVKELAKQFDVEIKE